jgi:hypothetical protein
MSLTQAEFYIIEPAEATNEVLNPSLEYNTTGYTVVGAGVTIARSTIHQRRGLWSLEVTPASGVESGTYYGAVDEVNSVSRTFAVDIKGVASQTMRVQIRTTAGAVLSEQTFTANGFWQRVKITRAGTLNTTRRLYVVRDAVASTEKFYLDGFYYSTVDGTYLDGDMRGFLNDKKNPEYRWTGARHASTSWRSGQSRSGGTMLRIKDYAKIILVLGLGMAPVTNLAVPTANGYSSYQNTLPDNREIIFKLAINGSNPGDVQDKRQALIDAARPDRTSVKQPLIIRYQGLDAAGGDASEPVDIYAHYTDGLEDGPGQPFYEEPNLRFTQYLPFLSKAGDSGIGLGYNTSVANFANIGFRDTDGTWKAMGTGAGVAFKTVYTIAIGPDGAVYAGGNFSSMSGVANTAFIAKWDGNAWSSLGLGAWAVTDRVKALAFGPDGSLYVGGTFPSAGGVANTVNIAKWNGSTWSALGTGTNGQVNALAFGPDGTLYAGGEFALAGGVANTARVAKWNGSAWSALGTGMDSGVNALAVDASGKLYAGGQYNTAGGVAIPNLAKWTGSAWSSLGFLVGGGEIVDALAFGPDGTLYVGGIFTTPGNNIVKYNGSHWSALNAGTNGRVRTITAGPDGFVYVGGDFTTAGGVTMPDRGAIWNGSFWLPLDINVQDSAANFYTFTFDRFDRFYMGGNWTGTTALSATVTASTTGNTGSATYPQVVFVGPGMVWQLKNYTNDKSIYFKNLSLSVGERAVLDLRPGKVAFKSLWRGDLSNYILNGSNLRAFQLEQGNNNISAYMTGTSAESGIVMTWQDAYWSIDGAKR